MKLVIVGTGYVGLVTGACFAEMGNHVICVDVDKDKLARLNRGEIPIYEPGLEQIVERNFKRGSLEFTDDLKAALDSAQVAMIAVGTRLVKTGPQIFDTCWMLRKASVSI